MRLPVVLRASGPVLPTSSSPLRRLRRRLRTPSLYWTAAVLAGALTTGVMWHLVSVAETGARRYGDSAMVAVVSRTLHAGATLGAGDVEMVRLPVAMVPLGALRSSPARRTLRVDMVRGEVLLAGRLAPGGTSSAAAMMAPSQRALAIPLPEAHLDLRPGDLVDVLTVSEAGSSTVIASRARVLTSRGRSAVVAIGVDEVADVNDALAAGTASLALIGK